MAFRRKRGAQPGNVNARKHGFYAGALAPGLRKVLRRARAMDARELKEEIDLMRTKMYQLANVEPENVTVLTLAGGLLVRMVALHHGLSAKEEEGLHESFVRLIGELGAGGGA